MELLQRIYEKILAPFAGMNVRLTRVARNVLVFVCFFVLFSIYAVGHARHGVFMTIPLEEGEEAVEITSGLTGFLLSIYKLKTMGRAIVMTVILALVTVFSVERRTVRKRWNWLFFALWVLCLGLIIISGTFHNIGPAYYLSSISVLIFFPMIYYAWDNREELDVFFEIVCLALCVVMIIVWIVSMKNYHIEIDAKTGLPVRYGSFTSNVNLLAQLASAGLCAALYLITLKKWKLAPIIALSFGAGIGLLLLSQTRSSLLGVLLAAAFCLFVYVKTLEVSTFKKDVALLGVVLVVSFVLYGMTYNTISTPFTQDSQTAETAVVRMLPDSMITYADTEDESDSNQQETEQEDDADADDEDAEADADADTTAVDDIKPAGSTVEDDDEDDELAVLSRLFEKGNKNLNQFSSGRLGVWQMYSEYINMTGNDISYTLPIRVLDSYGKLLISFKTAHNSIIEVAFRNGIPAALCYALIEIVAVLFVLSRLFIKKKSFRPEDAFTIAFVLLFLIEGNLESMISVYSRIGAFQYQLALLPLFGMMTRNEVQELKNEKRRR